MRWQHRKPQVRSLFRSNAPRGQFLCSTPAGPFFRSLITRSKASTFLLFFSTFSCFGSFLLFNRAAGFLSPQPHFATAGARRACQGWPLLQRPPKAWPLHDRARRQTGGVGAECASIRSICANRRLPISAGYTVLFAVECRSPHHGPSKASAPQCPKRDHRGVAGRITRSPRPVPAGTTFRQDGESGLRHAAGAIAGCHWNGCLVVHIRCRMTANLRATATVAFLAPIFLARAWPHVFSVDGRHVRLSRTFAAS